MNHNELTSSLFSDGPTKALAETPPFSFQELIKNIENPKDKILVACIAAFCDLGLAEQLVGYLTTLPETLEEKLEKEMYGVKIKSVLGLNATQAERAFGISAPQLAEIQNYLGLTHSETEN